MPDEKRVYRDSSEAELIDLRNRFRAEVKEAEEESRRCWSDNNPEMGEWHDGKVARLEDAISNIDTEFYWRSEERRVSREQRNTDGDSA